MIVFVIAAIVAGVEFLRDEFAGCNDELLSKFVRLELAQVYEREYIDQMVVPSDVRGLNLIKGHWEIEKQGNGCNVQFIASYYYLKNNYYYGDVFFINKQDKTVYPISEGAKFFLDNLGFPTKLP